MAGFLTHEWIAYLILKKVKIKKYLSEFDNIDDYFFGAVAPDIRYILNTGRELTHQPTGKESLFEALKSSTLSTPFVAGYETHLITDQTWSNEENWMNESIYEHYHIDPNNLIQKLTLYGLVDDYFQAKADWFFPIMCAGNIARANDFTILKKLGVSKKIIQEYKVLLEMYLKEPGIDTINILNFFPNNQDENMVEKFLDNKTTLTKFLKKFEKTAVEKSIEQLERFI
jgi:hypothetical protein